MERTFRAMIISRPEAPAGARVVAELTVTRWGDGYRVAGSGIRPRRARLEEARRAIRYHATRASVESASRASRGSTRRPRAAGRAP